MRFVLTRYSMAIAGTRIAATDGFETWLEKRLAIFAGYCLPSVVSQIERPDYWLIGFDGEARAAVAPVLAAIAPHPWIVPVWQTFPDGRHEAPMFTFRSAIEARLEGGRTHVITTRLDNDDLINRWFLRDVSRYAEAVAAVRPEAEDFWVSFPIGSIYHAGRCQLFTSPANHFLSRVQTIAHFRANERSSALVGNHRLVFGRGAVFMPMTTEPMWIEVVHGDNLSNKARKMLPRLASAKAEFARCGVSLDVAEGFARKPRRRMAAAWRSLRESGAPAAQAEEASTGLISPQAAGIARGQPADRGELATCCRRRGGSLDTPARL